VPNCCPMCEGEGCEECAQSGMPGMIGEGDLIEIPSTPEPVPNAAPEAPQARRPRIGAPVGPAVTPMPKARPVSTGASRTSQLPGLIGPIGYHSAG
jgi:hypothetical protein